MENSNNGRVVIYYYSAQTRITESIYFIPLFATTAQRVRIARIFRRFRFRNVGFAKVSKNALD